MKKEKKKIKKKVKKRPKTRKRKKKLKENEKRKKKRTERWSETSWWKKDAKYSLNEQRLSSIDSKWRPTLSSQLVNHYSGLWFSSLAVFFAAPGVPERVSSHDIAKPKLGDGAQEREGASGIRTRLGTLRNFLLGQKSPRYILTNHRNIYILRAAPI